MPRLLSGMYPESYGTSDFPGLLPNSKAEEFTGEYSENIFDVAREAPEMRMTTSLALPLK